MLFKSIAPSLYPKGVSFKQLKEPIKQAISSGSAQTAGDPKLLRY